MTTAAKRVRGEQIDSAKAYNYLLDSSLFGKKRNSKDAFDFGDDATVGKHLKRRYLTFNEYEIELDFGVFLGKHADGKWVVGIWNTDCSNLVGGEVFDSLGDLKGVWQLD